MSAAGRGLSPRLLTLVLAVTACDGIDNFDVDASGTASVEARTLIDEIIGLVPFEGLGQVDFEQEFRNQGVSEDDVDSVVVKSFVLTIETPATQSFEFLERVAFFASAEGLDYDVTVESGFALRGKLAFPMAEPVEDPYGGEASCNNWWTDASSVVKRSVVMDDFVYGITDTLIQVSSLEAVGTPVGSVDLAAPAE